MSTASPEDQAIAALREAVALDPVPPEVIAAARASFVWRTIDAELAALAFDSLDAGELVGARSSGGPRSLSFEYGAVAIELEVPDRVAATMTVQGQVAPGQPEVVEIHHADHQQPFAASVRSNGRFEAAEIPYGPIRLLVRFPASVGPAMLLTEWVTL